MNLLGLEFELIDYFFWFGEIRYEKDKARRIAAHRRVVLRIESRIAEHTRRLQELQDRRAEEADKIRTVASELSNLHKVR